MTLIFQVLHSIAQAIQPFLVGICFIFAWTLIILLAWSGWTTFRESTARAKRMHRIPCSKCQFFTGDYRLKCAVHPSIALSEAAIDCPDYQPVTNPFTAAAKPKVGVAPSHRPR